MRQTLCDARAVNKDGALNWEQQIDKQTKNLHTRLEEKQEATKQRLKHKKKLQKLAETAELDLEDVFGLPEAEDELKESLRTQSQLRSALQKQYTANEETQAQIKEEQKVCLGSSRACLPSALISRVVQSSQFSSLVVILSRQTKRGFGGCNDRYCMKRSSPLSKRRWH